VTGIELTGFVEAPRKGQARQGGPLGIHRKKIALKDENGRFLDISAENYV
jgi:hypothetical protein